MNKNKKYLILITLIILTIIIPITLFIISNKQKSNLEEKIINYVISSVPVGGSGKESKLEYIFLRNFGNDSEYSVVIKNFKTGEEFKFNEKKEFNSASLYKLWILSVVIQSINDGEISPEEIITGDKNKFDETLGLITPEPTSENISEENKEIEPVYISMKISDAVEKMITKSDNYAALLLTQKLGYKNINSFLEDYGFKNSNFESPPKTTAADIALFYEMLYNGEIINKKSSNEMIEILKAQTLNDRIPKYLPNKIVVAHKTGELFGAKHDAGIVYAEDGDYMIIVLSQTDNETEAAEKIAKFSEQIYKYFIEES